MLPGFRTLALGLFLPALLCGGILAAAERGTERARSSASGVAFGLSWFVAYLAWAGIPAFPSAEQTPGARDWLAWIVLLAGMPSPFIREGIAASVSRALFSVALAGLSLWAQTLRSGSWTGLAIVAIAIFVLWSLADRWIADAQGPRAPLALLVSAIATSFASLFAHGALIGSLAGALAACIGASLALALFVPAFHLRRGGSGVVVLVLAGCLVNARFFADLSLASTLLLAGSIVTPGLSPRVQGRWKSALASAAFALVPAALGLWIAWTPEDSAY